LLFGAVIAATGPGCEPLDADLGWCLQPPTADLGRDTIPVAGSDLLHGGLALDPATTVCPAADFSDWPAFVRRHSDGYTDDPRFGGFDDDCVPRIDLQGRYSGVGITQTPLVVANYGLLRYGDLLRGTTPDGLPEACVDPAEGVLATARWLRDNADRRTFEGVEHWAFPYDFPNLQGDLDPPWTSGYAQGIAAPAFVAAWCVSQDAEWLEAATRTLAHLTVRMGDGGAATWSGDEAVWFEEVAARDARSARSLNGHLGAAAGVHAVAQWTGSAGVERLRDLGFQAAVSEIDRYDAGFISLYTQWAVDHPLIAPALDYNRFHVQQLSWLYETAGDIRGLEYALRFARYDDPFATWSDASESPASVDFTLNAEFLPEWSVPRPGVLEVELAREQTVDGLVMWSPDPHRRPERLVLELSADGDRWTTTEHDWTPGCRDFGADVGPTRARFGRVRLDHDRGLHDVALQAIGLLRSSGHPTGVARWQEHGVANRPASAFTDVGWGWGRASAATFDLDGAFEDVEVVMTGFRGDALPTWTVAEALVGPFRAVDAGPSESDGVLTWRFPVEEDYLRLLVDTPSNPDADARLFIRQ